MLEAGLPATRRCVDCLHRFTLERLLLFGDFSSECECSDSCAVSIDRFERLVGQFWWCVNFFIWLRYFWLIKKNNKWPHRIDTECPECKYTLSIWKCGIFRYGEPFVYALWLAYDRMVRSRDQNWEIIFPLKITVFRKSIAMGYS